MRARAWNEEMDKLYTQLASMPEGSPEARAFWEQIQQRKDGKWQTVFSFAEAAQKEAGKLSTNKHNCEEPT